jgi:5-methylcytosine-specific restriction endonuclease McrA
MNARYIPAQVRRAVWDRDQGQCTFAGSNGKRCGSRVFLQFDHVEPVARGGRPTVDGVRLRCRAHNQYEAERVFGSGFMSDRLEVAQQRAKRSEGDLLADENRRTQ